MLSKQVGAALIEGPDPEFRGLALIFDCFRMEKNTLSASDILDIVQRVEALEARKADIKESLTEVFHEAESKNLEPKFIRHIVKLRKMELDEYYKQELLLFLYKKAAGLDVVSDKD